MKQLRIHNKEYGLILKATVSWSRDQAEPTIDVKIGLPRKATRLEKLLLKFVQIYCYDEFCQNMRNLVKQSPEYCRWESNLKMGWLKDERLV